MAYTFSSVLTTDNMELILTDWSNCLDNGFGKIIREDAVWREKYHSLNKLHGIVHSPEKEIIFAVKNGLQIVRDLVKNGFEDLYKGVTADAAKLFDFSRSISERDLTICDRLRRCIALNYTTTDIAEENECLKYVFTQHDELLGNSTYLITFTDGNIGHLFRTASDTDSLIYKSLAKIRYMNSELLEEIGVFNHVLEQMEKLIFTDIKPHLQKGKYWTEAEAVVRDDE
jgi:hypothetical protein